MSFAGTPVLIAVEFAGISQHTDAWHLLNGEDIIEDHPDRGDNLVQPMHDGRLGQPFFDDEMEVSLRYLFDGNVDPDGVPHPDPVHGLAENKRRFRSEVLRAARDALGCVSCRVVDVDGAEYTGGIQLRRLRFGEGDLYQQPAVLTARIPTPLVESFSS